MNFTAFQDLRRTLLAEQPGLIDCAETNLYRALAPLIPTAPLPTEKVHRCHLATQWVEYFGLPGDVSKRAFITCGVRDSLNRLFTHAATKSLRLWLPEDNYPVYHELAKAAGITPMSFPTLPEIRWPEEAPSDQNEFLLLTNPLKPRGRFLDEADAAHLKTWLAASSRRRVLLDTVYALDMRFDARTLDLFATDQVILLHSLTKGWLHPRLFGVALVPEADFAEWMPVFRDAPPPQENLAAARFLLRDHPQMPSEVAASLEAARLRLAEAWPDLFERCLPTTVPSYFFPIQVPWQQLLEYGVLGLPASTFGSSREDFTLLSSLTFIAP